MQSRVGKSSPRALDANDGGESEYGVRRVKKMQDPRMPTKEER